MSESVRNARLGKGLRILIKQSAGEVAAPQLFNRPSLRGSRNSTGMISSRPHPVRNHVESDLARGKSIEGPLVGGTQFSSAIVIAHPNSFLMIPPEVPLPLPFEQCGQEACPPPRPSRESTRRCPRRSGSTRAVTRNLKRKEVKPTLKTITPCKLQGPVSTFLQISGSSDQAS
jgi:hypothetical protein